MRDRGSMKIGYVLKRFPRLSETFVLNEILELERQGHQIEVFSLLRPPSEDRHAMLGEMKAHITYLPSTSVLSKVGLGTGLDWQPVTLAELAAEGAGSNEPIFSGKTASDIATLHIKAAALAILARSRGVTNLHAHFGSDAATVALLAGRMCGLPFSFTAHARDIYHTYTTMAQDNAMRRAKIDEAAFVATVSEYNRRHLCRVAPASVHQIKRLYNGIDLSRFTPRSEARRKGLIIAVGRLVEKKGFGDLLSACEILRRTDLEFHCRIIGDGPLRETLESRIAALGIDDHVEIVGPQPQEKLLDMMREASLAVLPCIVSESGDRDGLPTVLLEAMALGLPVVTTTVSGGPEIVVHGETGLLVEPSDPIGLAASLEALLASPESMWRMGMAGRQRAEKLFSLNRNVAVLAGYLTAAAADRRRGAMLEAV